jgi:hypothetical protein
MTTVRATAEHVEQSITSSFVVWFSLSFLFSSRYSSSTQLDPDSYPAFISYRLAFYDNRSQDINKVPAGSFDFSDLEYLWSIAPFRRQISIKDREHGLANTPFLCHLLGDFDEKC